jgi:hypothetical protein
MDPNACFARFLSAALADDFPTALSAAEDLAAWMSSGGFEPTWPRGWSRDVFRAWLREAVLCELTGESLSELE